MKAEGRLDGGQARAFDGEPAGGAAQITERRRKNIAAQVEGWKKLARKAIHPDEPGDEGYQCGGGD